MSGVEWTAQISSKSVLGSLARLDGFPFALTSI
jgi:hypothetical protein